MPNASSTAGTGATKPMASSTRSALSVCSEPATSCILPSFHSTRTVFRPVTLPPSPISSLVEIANSRSQPSSCEDEVRSLIGQYGQVMGRFSSSGGWGISSNWVTLAAPWRLLVPTQSEPVSPPPITITCLPSARNWSLTLSPALTLFCWGRNSIAKCTPAKSRPGTGRSRDCSAPHVSSTASKSFCSCSGVMVSLAQLMTFESLPSGSWVLPTMTPVRKVTPSACICATRRSMWTFSILKSGMP